MGTKSLDPYSGSHLKWVQKGGGMKIKKLLGEHWVISE